MDDQKKTSLREPETFRELLHLRFTGRDRAFPLSGKLGVYKLLTRLGFPTAELHRTWPSAQEIDLTNLPSEVVVKPNHGWSKRGVYVLYQIAGGNGWWDGLSQRRVTEETIRAELSDNERKWHKGKSIAVLAEERVQGEHNPRGTPLDYKFYTFNGEIRLIIQVDRNVDPPAVAFYDRDFSSWDFHRHLTLGKQLQLGEPIVPERADEMLDIVSKLSRALETPFVSIDTYASQRGPLVGELTRTPGGAYFRQMWTFSPDFERELAMCWKRAAGELGQEIGLIDPSERIPLKRQKRPDVTC